MNAEIFLVVPGLVYAWYALDEWIGDRDSYAEVISVVEHRYRRLTSQLSA